MVPVSVAKTPDLSPAEPDDAAGATRYARASECERERERFTRSTATLWLWRKLRRRR